MRVLLVGAGGVREHILVEQLARSSEVSVLTPKRNPALIRLVPKSFICNVENLEVIGSWALQERIDLAVITSEDALVAGLSDALEKIGIAVASPSQLASAFAWDRAAAFRLMDKAGIAHPSFTLCQNPQALSAAFKGGSRPFVVKPPFHAPFVETRAFAPAQKKAALQHGKKLLRKYKGVLIQSIVDGAPFVLHAFSDGRRLSIAPPVQAVPRLEPGKIYGGAWASYSTGRYLPFLTAADVEKSQATLQRCIDALRQQDRPFKGMLSAEFVYTKRGPILMNFSPVLGNPEALNVFGLLHTELAEILQSMVDGQLKPVSFQDTPTMAKYLVPEGYPAKPKKKKEIDLNERAVWDAGVKYYVESLEEKNKKYFTTHERTIVLLAKGESLEEAESRIETAASHFTGPLTHWTKKITAP